MKKLALAAISIGSLALFACGGGGSGGGADAGGINPVTPDAGAGAADAGAACNPVAGSGCATGQKCTFVVESTDPFLGQTQCATDGTVAKGGTCTRDMTSGIDDCVGGTWCSGGACAEICSSAPNSCGMGETCVQFNGLFTDADNTGLCDQACSPVDVPTGCAMDEGCFVNLGTGEGSCAAGFVDAPESMTNGMVQGTSCSTNPGGQGCNCIYLNGCQNGFGCVLNNAPGMASTGLSCAFFCESVAMPTGPTCTGPDFISAGWRCAQIMTFYNNSENNPPELGMCVNNMDFPCAGCFDNTTPGCEDNPANGATPAGVCCVDNPNATPPIVCNP